MNPLLLLVALGSLGIGVKELLTRNKTQNNPTKKTELGANSVPNSSQYIGSQKSNPIVQATQITPTATSTPKPTYNPDIESFINNIRVGRTQTQFTNIPQDLKDAVTSVSASKNINPSLLYALANKESNMQNIAQTGGGLGRGYFQIDLGQQPGVTEQQAYDPNYSAGFAADKILNDLNYFKTKGSDNPVTRGTRAYNAGRTGASKLTLTNQDQTINPVNYDWWNKFQNYLGDYNY